MRKINLETWPRREIFSFYNSFSNPHFNMCANVDLTEIYPVIKQRGISFNLAVVYLLARTANHIPDFRYRIHGDSVVEYKVVHPSSTIMTEEDLFSFCTFEYAEDFSDFATKAVDRISYVKENPAVKKDSGDDLLFMTAIPWVTFTSFMHPLHLNPPDSVPRFAWGKFYLEGERIKMPLSVQVHHALMDGIHIGRFYEKLQFFLDHPELAL
jgi:chloramphenicol O-acetyltransferase type A